MNIHEICVHIKDDEMLQKAKELLEKHREKIDLNVFYLSNESDNFLQYSDVDNDWFMSRKGQLTEITLDQLDGILKN